MDVALAAAGMCVGESREIIVDMRRASSIEAAACSMLAQFANRARERGTRVVLTGLSERDERLMLGIEGVEPADLRKTLDEALEESEERILQRLGAHNMGAGEIPLREHPLLKGLEPCDLEHIEAISQREQFTTGEVVFNAGAPGDSIYLIAGGVAAVTVRLPSGMSHRVAVLGPGTSFGEFALLEEAPRSATVEAQEPLTCWRIPIVELLDRSKDNVAPRSALVEGNRARPRITIAPRKRGNRRSRFLIASIVGRSGWQCPSLSPLPAIRYPSPMKFGVLQFFSWTRRIPLETVYERAFERIAIMDQTGYDCVWLAEHHFNTYSVCPSVTLMGTHIAARTKNLRIGMGVTLAPLYHPLRLAEELAMLDIFSGGRLNWGAGRGFDASEFRAFEVDVADSRARLNESVEIVHEAWKGERFSHHGKFWQIRDIEVLPQPKQKPMPPFWMAASSPDAAINAAEKGFSIMQDPHSSHVEIGRKRAIYMQAMKDNGFSIEGRDLPIVRVIAVGETREQARQTAKEGASWMLGSYLKVRASQAAGDPAEEYVNDVVIYGTPEEVADRIIEQRDTIGMDYLIAAPLSHESFLMFTEKVMPLLR